MLTLDSCEVAVNDIKVSPTKFLTAIDENIKSGSVTDDELLLLALATVPAYTDDATRRAAFKLLPKAAPTADKLFKFVSYMAKLRGWGDLPRLSIASWYNDQPIKQLSRQLIRYRKGNGWEHKDVLRMTHIKAVDDEHNQLYKWVLGHKAQLPEDAECILAYEAAKNGDLETIREAVTAYGLTFKELPEEALIVSGVFDLLIDHKAVTVDELTDFSKNMPANIAMTDKMVKLVCSYAK